MDVAIVQKVFLGKDLEGEVFLEDNFKPYSLSFGGCRRCPTL